MYIKTFFGLILVILITFSVSWTMARYQKNLEMKTDEFTEYIAQIPETFGSWSRIAEEPLPDYAMQELKIKDSKVWYYTNALTGEEVSVFVMVGPTGRLSVHTPEICVAGGEVVETTGRVPVQILPRDSETEKTEKVDNRAFWKVRINERLSTNVQRLFYYTMGTGTEWFASEQPRYEFAEYPVMIKIQAEAIVFADDQSKEDILYRFLQDFLPELDKIFEGKKLID